MDYASRTEVHFSGGDGLSSTIKDSGVFLQMLLTVASTPGVRILAPNTVRTMTTDQLGSIDIPQGKFGLGSSIVPEDVGRFPSRPGTFGWGGAPARVYWGDPVESVVLLLYRQMWGPSKFPVDDPFRVLGYQAMER